MDLATELYKIYDSEIIAWATWLWDAEIEACLGHEINGSEADQRLRSVERVF